MKKLAKAILLSLLVLVILFVIFSPLHYAFLFLPGMPRERIVISLPFSPEEECDGITPLGEQEYHPPPTGHPGIDFGFPGEAKVIASADGEILDINLDKENEWELEIRSGLYIIRYAKLSDYDQSLKVGSFVKKGDFLGYPQSKKKGNSAFHWELASLLHKPFPWEERICPVSYFDEGSLRRLNDCWERTQWEFKWKYPEICSAWYKGKDE